MKNDSGGVLAEVWGEINIRSQKINRQLPEKGAHSSSETVFSYSRNACSAFGELAEYQATLYHVSRWMHMAVRYSRQYQHLKERWRPPSRCRSFWNCLLHRSEELFALYSSFHSLEFLAGMQKNLDYRQWRRGSPSRSWYCSIHRSEGICGYHSMRKGSGIWSSCASFQRRPGPFFAIHADRAGIHGVESDTLFLKGHHAPEV